MEPSFEKLLGLLAESRVQFVVVGGVAVTLHGYVRLTDDIDLLVSAEASKEALIAWKEKSVRDKDRLDALALKRLRADSHAFD
jgi:hypothetical protein